MNAKIIENPQFGDLAILWSWLNEYPQIIRIILSKPDLSAENQLINTYPHYDLSSCDEVDELATSIQAFLDGADIKFPLDIMALNNCSPFQKAVLLAEYEIQRGNLSTYKLIAQHLGKGGGARAVGNALAGNPFPIVIPCHRAIRSDGYVGGFQGGVAMKKALLEKEGIKFDAKGRAISPQLQYNPQ